MIKDSGNRTEFKSGAVRDIQEGKGRCDLLPLHVISMWLGDPIFGMIEQYRNKPAYDPTPKSTRMVQILDKFAEYCNRKGNDRYSLVLEVAKHFEEGAKKYGDRNWEKGIPCDRYIDSAVRHYCKWRAGWTDEPHDRAFIWNIVCCEWTRQRYGWNLERLGEKSDDSDIRDFLDTEFTMIVDGDFTDIVKILGIEPVKEKDQKVSDLKAACDLAKRQVSCHDAPVEFCCGRECDTCEYYTDSDELTNAIGRLSEYVEKSLKECEEVDNRYIRNVTGGVELYDDVGQFVGYVHGFTDPKESGAIIRSIVEKSWGLLTFNAYTLEKIIGDHGYITEVDFVVDIFKDYRDIKLPKHWHVIKRKSTEENE